MKSILPNKKQIKELIKFYPLLCQDGYEPVEEMCGGQKMEILIAGKKSTATTMPYPKYKKEVKDFINVASQECWSDYQYNDEQVSRMLTNPNIVESANIEQIKSMVTFCVRGERFCDGNIGILIKKGIIRLILKRLKVISTSPNKTINILEVITPQQILDKADCLDREDLNISYQKSYFYFVKFFCEKRQITEQDLIIGANFTYGWMPTILNFKSDQSRDAITILNKAKHRKRISIQELALLKGLINNSLVGTSKLLHFINPDVYAIWDSRVCKFLTGKSYKQTVEKIDLFWAYLDLCQRVAQSRQFAQVHHSFIRKIGYEVSPMRTIEQIMFLSKKKLFD